MTQRFQRGRSALVVAVAAALAMTGCGTSSPSAESPSSAQAGFPVSITSPLGTAEIPSPPKRVVTLGWGSTEAAVALGVIPVGMRDMTSDSGSADGILPWVKDKLGGQQPQLLAETSQSIPVEQIAALKPDVILSVRSGLTAEQYAQLSRIAPTVAQPGKAWQTSWQDQTTIVGKALGKESEATALINETNTKIADVKAANPAFAGKTVVSGGGTTTNGLNLYFDTDPRVQLLEGFGFSSLPAVARLKETAAEGAFATEVSWENLAQYNSDVLTAWYFKPETERAIEAMPSFAALTAVERKAYAPVSDPTLAYAVSSPNVQNMSWLLERYVPLLQEAAKNAG